jgi:hypothetical protein
MHAYPPGASCAGDSRASGVRAEKIADAEDGQSELINV